MLIRWLAAQFFPPVWYYRSRYIVFEELGAVVVEGERCLEMRGESLAAKRKARNGAERAERNKERSARYSREAVRGNREERQTR